MPTFTNAEATLPVSDLARARKFYEETIGLPFVEEGPAGMRFSAGKGEIFVYPSQFAGTNQATALGLEVEDLDSAVVELRERGITFEQYDFPGLKTDENGIANLGDERGAWFKDPDGNILSVGQRVR